MGVRYHQCAVCKQSIYEEAVARCESCSQFVCVTCAVRLPKGLKLTSGDIFDPDESAPLFNGDNRLLSKHCPMCSGRAVSDEQVVARLLKKLGTTRVKVERQVVAERKVAKKTGTRKKTAGMKQPRKAAVKKPKAATQRSRNR